jgi:hypothetical protein
MNYTPVATFQGKWGAMGSSVHLIQGNKVSHWNFGTHTLCGKRAAQVLPGTARDATCSVCRLKAGVSRRR